MGTRIESLIPHAPAGRESALALYVHIPFCETKCPYCDFNTYAGIEGLIPAYVDALATEIRVWGNRLAHPEVSSVFFGGGTPTYIPSRDLARLLDAVHGSFRVQLDAEVTMEGNPGDFSAEKLACYLAAGVNRLSVGVQSFDDRLLDTLGRRHSAHEARSAIQMAREAGFSNISLDLMLGLPHQNMVQWEASLEAAAELKTQHLSLYALTLEPNTPLAAWVQDGCLPTPDEDLTADMYLQACEHLESQGFHHYEISNWALPGLHSRHNLAYWRNAPYLGVGPGAHSSLGGVRFANMTSPRGYVQKMRSAAERFPSTAVSSAPGADGIIDQMKAHGPVSQIELVTQELDMADTVMMGLRLSSGISLQGFRQRTGRDVRVAYSRAVRECIADGSLLEHSGRMWIPHDRWLLANEVLARFFATGHVAA